MVKRLNTPVCLPCGRSAVGRQNTNNAHQLGKVRSTKSYRQIKLIYYEAYKDKRDATKREYELKTGQQREFLKKRLIYSRE